MASLNQEPALQQKEADVEQPSGYDFNQVKEKKIKERLNAASECIHKLDYEGALIEFNKVIFYDKNIPEVYAEKAEIYMKLCDFSSAIQ